MNIWPSHPSLLHLKVLIVSLVSETSLSVHLEMLELDLIPPWVDGLGAQAACRGQKRGPSTGWTRCLMQGLGLRVGFPLLGRNPSAGNIARSPGGWGCNSISEMKTGTPRRGSWSCLFLPGIKTLIQKRVRKPEALAGSAIPRRGEHERPASQGL